MGRDELHGAAGQAGTAVPPRGVEDLTDGQLLGRFLSGRDEAAFAALVRRHGPMVFNVCLRVLGNVHDAEDALQATFLVLVRRAASVGAREQVGNWLFGVAYRTALKARAGAARRRRKEQQVPTRPHAEPEAEALWLELRPLLDQELNRLPDKYRVPVVLCELEGRPRRDVARQLNLPEGTLSSRLATARKRLAVRLARRGVAVSAAAWAVLAGQASAAALPPALAAATVRAATTGPAGAAGVSPEVLNLAQGVLKAMLLTRLKTVGALILTACLLGAASVFVYATASADPAARPGGKDRTDQERIQGTWQAVSGEVGGKKVKEELEKLTLEFTGNRFTLIHDAKMEQGTFRLDPSAKPKAFDLILPGAGGGDDVHKAIYKLEGDRLTICLAHPPAERPTTFATQAGERWPMLVNFKRVAKADNPRPKAPGAGGQGAQVSQARLPTREVARAQAGWRLFSEPLARLRPGS
jgi:RNA polymerase sigma factor (sigma-70 family)